MVLPVAYFIVLASGRFPLSAIIQWLPERFWIHPWLKKLPPLATATERQMSILFRRHPWLVLAALLLSVLVWIMMVFRILADVHIPGSTYEFIPAVAAIRPCASHS